MEIKFIEFIETHGEKHLGIATISIENTIYMRYKVLANQKGGYFLAPPSYRIKKQNDNNSEDSYIAAFVVDSNFLKEKIENLIRENVKNYFNNINEIPF